MNPNLNQTIPPSLPRSFKRGAPGREDIMWNPEAWTLRGAGNEPKRERTRGDGRQQLNLSGCDA